jgi:hypothetical protein
MHLLRGVVSMCLSSAASKEIDTVETNSEFVCEFRLPGRQAWTEAKRFASYKDASAYVHDQKTYDSCDWRIIHVQLIGTFLASQKSNQNVG